MNTRHLFFALVVAAAVGVSATLQDASKLRFSLEPRKDSFQFTSDMRQTLSMADMGMGDQQMVIKMSMKMDMETGAKGEDGKAPLTMAVSDFDMKMEGPQEMPNMDLPKTYSIKGKVDEFGRVSDSKIEGLEPSMAQMLNSGSQQSPYFVIFPDHAVKVGDTWKIPLPKNEAAMIQESELTAKLLGEKVWKDRAVYEIQMTGDILVEGDPSKMGGELPFAMKTKGKTTMDGLYTVEKASGRTLAYKASVKSDMRIELVDMGMTIGSKGEGTMSMDWIK